MSEPNPFMQLRILIADDDRFMTRLLKTMLLSLDVGGVSIANSFEEAIAYMDKLHFDVVVLDWLKGKDAKTTLLEWIRTATESQFPDLPIVLCTAYTEVEKIRLARDLGVSEIITKPISPRHLMLKIFAAVFHSRPFIAGEDFVGPDRRRRQVEWDGVERRNNQNLTQDQIDKMVHEPES